MGQPISRRGVEIPDGMTYFKGKLKKGLGKGTLIRQKR